ncbi:MAG: hypothetical protein RLZZ155_833 [Bacteroidota bacterium]
MRLPFLIVAFFLGLAGFAQQRGKVISFNTKKPLTGAVVKWTNGKQFAVTDENGEFSIPTSNNGYVVQSIGYYDYTTTKLGRVIELAEQIYQLPVMAITDAPDSVFGSVKYSVGDFVWWNGKLTMLLYEREKLVKPVSETRDLWEEAWIAQIDSFGKIVTSFHINEPAERFHLTPTGACFVLTENSVFQLRAEPFLHLDKLSYTTFHQEYEPICGFLHSNIVFNTFTEEYPEFSYYLLKDGSTDPIELERVADSLTMELFKSEYKYMNGRAKRIAYQYELDYGVPKEIVAGQMTRFKESPYYRDPVAKIVQLEERWSIFNISQKQVISINADGIVQSRLNMKAEGSIGSLTSKEKILSVQYVPDSKEMVCFTQLRTGESMLYLLKEDGSLELKKNLYWQHIRNPQIKNGRVYYLYRPFESRNNWYLYAE